MIAPVASTFGLDGWLAKLVLIAIAIVSAILALALLSWVLPKLAARVKPGSDMARYRQRQTAAALLATVLRYLILIATVLTILLIVAGAGGLGALGGSAVLAIIIGFASQRLLADMIAGFFILFEGQYGVGDVVTLEPSGHSGVVQEVGVRTTVLRTATGERSYIPNGQITAVRRFPSARAMLAVSLVTRDPEAAEASLGHIGTLVPAGAGVAASAHDIQHTPLSGGVTAVHARIAVASTLVGPARELVLATLRADLGEALASDPVVAAVEPREPERNEAVLGS